MPIHSKMHNCSTQNTDDTGKNRDTRILGHQGRQEANAKVPKKAKNAKVVANLARRYFWRYELTKNASRITFSVFPVTPLCFLWLLFARVG